MNGFFEALGIILQTIFSFLWEFFKMANTISGIKETLQTAAVASLLGISIGAAGLLLKFISVVQSISGHISRC